MECNRDEALRSLCIAEQKFLQHDLMCAKKFALKAQCLFPDLEGLPQLLAVLDVHIVAQQKVDGMEVNWYRILQTDASADEATIRKQYRKLALILHPDKNKSIGAEGAFKLISEAWRVLSDKDKKAAHDARRSYTAFVYPAAKPTKGVRNFTHFSACFQPRHAKSSNKSFWTGCPSCKMQYEYMRVHENKKIPCPTCGKVFRATDIETTDSKTKSQPSQQSSQVARSSCSEKQTERDRRSPLHMGSGFSFHWGNYMHNAAKHTATTNATADMVQQIYDTVRKERVKAQSEAREKAAMARMEAEREAWRRERMNRKLRRKEEQETPAKVSAHPDGSLENVVAQVTRCPVESWEVESVSFMPAKGVENGATDASSLNSGSHQKKEVGSRIGEKAARMDHMPEPFGCRIRNNFDSTSSYDSGDAFSFSKRLKVDV